MVSQGGGDDSSRARSRGGLRIRAECVVVRDANGLLGVCQALRVSGMT